MIACVLSLAFVATLAVAPRFSMSFSAACFFFGATAAGPFSVLFHGNWILSSPELIVAILVFFGTVCYLVVPNNVTFVISLIGGAAWVVIGAFLILLLA